MKRTRKNLLTLLMSLAIAIAIPVVVAGCGGNDEDPATVLSETFGGGGEPANSGNLSLSLEGTADGEISGSASASLSGPFQTDPANPDSVPQLDWTGSLQADANGMTIGVQGGLIVTADNAYIEYGGKTYELGTAAFSQLQAQMAAQAAQAATAGEGEGLDPAATFEQACAEAIAAQGGDGAQCDFDFNTWITNLANDGTEDVDGTETIHISGDFNVEQMLTDIVGLGASVQGVTAEGITPELIQGQLGPIVNTVEEASFDVYSGVDDKVLRKIDLTIKLDLSGIPMTPGQQVDSLTLNISASIGDLNSAQTIAAPTGDILPISDLTGDEGLGVPGLDSGSTSSGSDSDPSSELDGQAYAACLDAAETEEDLSDCFSAAVEP